MKLNLYHLAIILFFLSIGILFYFEFRDSCKKLSPEDCSQQKCYLEHSNANYPFPPEYVAYKSCVMNNWEKQKGDVKENG